MLEFLSALLLLIVLALLFCLLCKGVCARFDLLNKIFVKESDN